MPTDMIISGRLCKLCMIIGGKMWKLCSGNKNFHLILTCDLDLRHKNLDHLHNKSSYRGGDFCQVI